ncbi:response regulator transcription factor [Plantactinospora sp. CA-294935]|uniref:response regulator transcription factor n=1 Tax=Plantactinospora sp. CA-294935 TaxID=3240012 RepID=UPI003D91F982
MATGRTIPRIAGDLAPAERTVKTHGSAIFTKLGVRDRAAATVYAYDAGIVRSAVY